MATGQLANAIDRDLLADGLRFDDLGWRGLWCYITEAPPNSAISRRMNDDWTFDHHLLAEMLYELRKLHWRYTAIHFKDGTKVAFPTPIARPGVEPPVKTQYTKEDWDSVESAEDLIPEHVRELMKD